MVLAGSGDGRWYVVTARTMTDPERRVYNKKGDLTMMSDKDNLAETAEVYDTHDISADMQAGEWTRHEGKHAETAMSGVTRDCPPRSLTTRAPSREPEAWPPARG